MCKCVPTDPTNAIFHWKYVQMCQGCVQIPANVNISIEICVNVFQLMQNVNISFEICANVCGI